MPGSIVFLSMYTNSYVSDMYGRLFLSLPQVFNHVLHTSGPTSGLLNASEYQLAAHYIDQTMADVFDTRPWSRLCDLKALMALASFCTGLFLYSFCLVWPQWPECCLTDPHGKIRWSLFSRVPWPGLQTA